MRGFHLLGRALSRWSLAGLLNCAWDVTNIRKAAGAHGTRERSPHASKGGNKTPRAVVAASARGSGPPPQQSTIPSDLTRPGMAQQNPLGSLFGSAWTVLLAGTAGLHGGLQSANGGSIHGNYSPTRHRGNTRALHWPTRDRSLSAWLHIG